MAIEIKAPQFPESVEEGSIATWHKQVGESVSRDELIVDIETDKTVLEVVAAADGVLTEVMKQEGDIVLSQELIGKIEAGAVASAPTSAAQVETTPAATATDTALAANPAAKKLAEENNIDLSNVKGTGKDGRILKEDVQNALSASTAANSAAAVPSAPAKPAAPVLTGERIEKRVPMTRLRATIAKRLLDAQHNSAMLTTFNEVREYWGNPESTHNAFIDGWFLTGDIAVIDDGAYRILGRASIDIIKSGGYKLSALEIEATLLDHPQVREVAVIGLLDDEWGELVAAAVVTEGNIDEATVTDWCRQQMSAYKVPRRWLFADALPRNALGKVTKPALKSWFEG